MSKKIAVIFGGTNTEHEVSIITALQVMHALADAGHQVLPLYISKNNQWIMGDKRYTRPEFYTNLNQVVDSGKPFVFLPYTEKPSLAIKSILGGYKQNTSFDIAFPVFHGKYGEDGSIHGLLKSYNIPIAGSCLLTSALGIDKYLTKRIAECLGINVLKDKLVTSTSWETNQKQDLNKLTKLGFPLIIKPSRLGSSIGLNIVSNKKELIQSIEVGLRYDDRILIEPAVDKFREVNISVLGNDPYQLSPTEEPVRSSKILSFEDKYTKGSKGKSTGKGMASSQRNIPAKISKRQLEYISSSSLQLFSAIGGKGLARIDFMLIKDEVYFNEINTTPGSMAFYLWEKSDMPFTQLVDNLVKLGIDNWQQQQSLIKSFESNLLSTMSLKGLKQ